MFQDFAISDAPPNRAFESDFLGATAFPHGRKMLNNSVENAPHDLAALDDFQGLEAPIAVIRGDGSQHFRDAGAPIMRSSEAKKWSCFAASRFPDHVGMERFKERTEIGLLETRRHAPH